MRKLSDEKNAPLYFYIFQNPILHFQGLSYCIFKTKKYNTGERKKEERKRRKKEKKKEKGKIPQQKQKRNQRDFSSS